MEKWSSKFGFLLASIGSAVGIGNIWRFSSIVGQNGGGAYLIPFLIAVFLFALPLMILEFSVGRYFQGGVTESFGKVKEKFRFVGWVICAIVFVILSYYLVITGWTLGFFVSSLTGLETTFSEFSSTLQPLFYFCVAVVITGFIVSFGVKKGIERIASMLMPFAFLLLIALAVFCTTLTGFGEGMNFFLSPDFSVLSEPMLWSAAFGQAFFSLSVGFGVLLTYGSYLEKNVNIAHSSLIITIADLSVAFLAGMIIFPIVFTFGLAPGMGAELAFSTLPIAFSILEYGQLLAIAFFLLLFVAALTSSVSMLEISVAAVMQKTSFSRQKTSIVLTLLLFIAGLPAALSYSSINLSIFGMRILDFLDASLGTMGLPITGFLTALVFTWFFQKNILTEELKSKRLATLVLYVAKYVIPIILVVVIGSQLVFYLS